MTYYPRKTIREKLVDASFVYVVILGALYLIAVDRWRAWRERVKRAWAELRRR